MTSSIIKGLTNLLTPVKTSKFEMVLSPLSLGPKSSSVISKKTLLPSSDFESWSCCRTSKNKVHSVALGQRSPLKYKAARCLFSVADERRPNGTLPSFDTPLRKHFSEKEIFNNTKSVILGRGSYGYVVKGRYKRRRVAVKILTNCQKQTEMIKSEMNAVKLKHPNIIDSVGSALQVARYSPTLIIEVSQVIVELGNNVGFVFMELYSNKNLEFVLQHEILHYIEKLRYLKQIVSALQYCHSKGILHLDVKPKNIIVKTEDKMCKLCDFGSSHNKSDRKETDNHRKGTLKYSAPELLKGENPTEKCDVYSFGITMWQTIHQEVPFDKEDLEEVVYKVVKYNYRPSCRKINYNMNIEHIYEACWKDDPKQRPSMSQVVIMMG